MKKITLYFISALIILICIVGIIFILSKYNNKVLTNNTFIKKMKNLNFEIYDAKKQFGDDIIKSATVAYTSNYQIEFIVFKDVDSAKNAFVINKENFASNKTENDIEKSNSNDSYSLYYLTTSDKYMYVKRINNSLLYLDVDGNYKKDVDAVIKRLKY